MKRSIYFRKGGKKLFIIGINGSARKDGNTAYLLQEALKVAEDLGARTYLLHVVDVLSCLSVPFCVNCSRPCNGRCSRGNELGAALDLLRTADGLIVGSPVYFGTVSAQLKAFWDRTRVLRREKALLNVVGGAVTVAGARFGGQETALRAIHDMMLVQGMIVVGDGHQDFDCGHQGVCAKEPAGEDKNALERLEVLTKRIVEVANATRSLRSRSQGVNA